MNHRPLSCALLLSVLACGLAAAAPKPPARPPETAPAPAPTPQPATPQTGTPAAPAERQPVDVDVQSLQPYNLPPASRAKMRACGEEWRAMKLAGQAVGLTWRAFAEQCLVK